MRYPLSGYTPKPGLTGGTRGGVPPSGYPQPGLIGAPEVGSPHLGTPPQLYPMEGYPRWGTPLSGYPLARSDGGVPEVGYPLSGYPLARSNGGLPKVGYPPSWTWPGYPPGVDRQTDTCQNITFQNITATNTGFLRRVGVAGVNLLLKSFPQKKSHENDRNLTQSRSWGNPANYPNP